nr:MAG TPA: hypothetical protein [Caudoviricetes sp.]
MIPYYINIRIIFHQSVYLQRFFLNDKSLRYRFWELELSDFFFTI